MADENTITVINNENPPIDIEITTYINEVGVNFIQSKGDKGEKGDIGPQGTKGDKGDTVSACWGTITGTLFDQADLNTALDGKVAANASITSATRTKITYDSKGLIISGENATTADVSDSTNKRYVTDPQLTVIGNTSGINTGDETAATIKSKLGITTLSGSNTGDQPASSTADMPTISSTASTSITFTAGFSWDSTLAVKMTLSSSYTKTLSSWVSGNGNGGLDTGTIAASTKYYIFQISNGTASDILYSLSATAPLMPSGYTYKRRIGAFLTNSCSQIIPIVQRGNTIYFKDPVSDVSTSNLGSTATAYTLSVPAVNGITAIFTYYAYRAAGGMTLYFYSPLQNTQTAISTMGRCYSTSTSTNYGAQGGQVEVLTDSGSIYAVADVASTYLYISTIGWKDMRGAN